jgi:hypothetical protein
MKEYIPDICNSRKTILSKPILFKDDFEFLLLNNKIKFNKQESIIKINNPDIFPVPETFVNNKIIMEIKKTEKIISVKGKIKTPKLLSDFILLPFSS